MTVDVRRVRRGDAPVLVELIEGLAEFERMRDQCTVTSDLLADALFTPDAAVFGHVVVEDGRIAGMALWYLTFSTWDGVHGIHLEDLYVRPGSRGRGHGRRLLAALASVCAERGYTRLEWEVLNWNAGAIRFYESIGAVGRGEWTQNRLTGEALAALAAEGDGR
ncbi:GNAT family N-acetyltransferase [Tomitella fengzijianii]|uniref:GNAT family N-acetyltransferase n=1 Tax=Tomitella fengzijianii TaxID=2597660 RepID=A0A516X531_9ACTN|nr:GNAT family N-acetyltransferase [Tomitella fengzijianii]QDQ98182.1 GNAT family N-acetyltransferase [Tomitella fengzijianii]